jgi:hypothetical protein
MRGAAGLEAVLALVVLAPLMTGLFVYGDYFWQAQRADVYAPQIPQSSVMGEYTCDELVNRVETAAREVMKAARLGSTGSVDARVVEAMPTQGVTVDIRVSVPLNTPYDAILPNDGHLVGEATQRLDYASLTTESCP